jgi:hypothetical protein
VRGGFPVQGGGYRFSPLCAGLAVVPRARGGKVYFSCALWFPLQGVDVGFLHYAPV